MNLFERRKCTDTHMRPSTTRCEHLAGATYPSWGNTRGRAGWAHLSNALAAAAPGRLEHDGVADLPARLQRLFRTVDTGLQMGGACWIASRRYTVDWLSLIA